MTILKQVNVAAGAGFQEVKPGDVALPEGDYVLSIEPVSGGLGLARFAINDAAPAADDATVPLGVNQPWPISVPSGSKLYLNAIGVDLIVHVSA